jgi:hypothetical protein
MRGGPLELDVLHGDDVSVAVEDTTTVEPSRWR